MAIMELLRRSCDELGQTVLIVTHESRAAARAARVVFLVDGRIVTEVRCKGLSEMGQRVRAVPGTTESLTT